MLEWDGRIQDNHSVQILKTAIPFFDIAIGERVDIEGLLGAVRGFASGSERHVIDMILQLFQMRRMMSVMQVMRTMQAAQTTEGGNTEPDDGGISPDMFEMLKAVIPPEQQETMDMAMSMMSMMQMANSSETGPEEQEAGEEGNDESVNF